jgi:tryptophan-rich sensory protein
MISRFKKAHRAAALTGILMIAAGAHIIFTGKMWSIVLAGQERFIVGAIAIAYGFYCIVLAIKEGHQPTDSSKNN